MEVALLWKVAGVGMLCAVACQILNKTGRDEQAMLLSVAGIVIVVAMLVSEIGKLLENVKSVFGL